MSDQDATTAATEPGEASPGEGASGGLPARRWLRRLRRVVLFVAVLYGVALGMLVAFESTLVYPRPPLAAGNWQPDLLDVEDVFFHADDGTRLHGWYLPHPEPRRFVVFFHGNAEHVGQLGGEMDALRANLDASVFVFDYRGYGRSEGEPHEAGLLLDGVAAQRWLARHEGIAPQEITLYGRSLGGGVAVATAASQGARALILDRTFHSMVDVAADMYRWAPVRLLMRNRYPSEERIAKYRGPLYQMHGKIDEIIPFESGQRLFQASPAPRKEFLPVEDLLHNDPAPRPWQQGIAEFLRSVER